MSDDALNVVVAVIIGVSFFVLLRQWSAVFHAQVVAVNKMSQAVEESTAAMRELRKIGSDFANGRVPPSTEDRK